MPPKTKKLIVPLTTDIKSIQTLKNEGLSDKAIGEYYAPFTEDGRGLSQDTISRKRRER